MTLERAKCDCSVTVFGNNLILELDLCFSSFQFTVYLYWFQRGRPRGYPQCSSRSGNILLHLYHRHCFLHGEHLRRFCYRHLPEWRRTGVQKLRAGQKSSMFCINSCIKRMKSSVSDCYILTSWSKKCWVKIQI